MLIPPVVVAVAQIAAGVFVGSAAHDVAKKTEKAIVKVIKNKKEAKSQQ